MDWELTGRLLSEKLDKAHVKPPAPGKYGEYIEGWHAIAEANRIFGHGGWSYTITHLDCVWSGERKTKNGDRPAASYVCRVMVFVDGVTREDVGAGSGFGQDFGEAHESASKEAVTDALKRALRSFGWPLGLALYDKGKINVEDTGARLGVEKRRDEILAHIKTITEMEELRAFWSGISKEIAGMNANGFAEMAAQIEVAKDNKKAELSELAEEGAT